MEIRHLKQVQYWKQLRALSASLAKRPVKLPAPSGAPARRENWFVRNKDTLGAVQSAVTIIGLILAFIWFQGQHQAAPKLKIEQSFSQRPYLGPGSTEGETLLSVQAWVTNVGNVSIYLDPGKIQIDEVNPRTARIYCDIMMDTDVAEPCDQTHPVEGLESRLLKWVQQSTIVGWFWRPRTASLRWIDPGERDQAFANVYRLRNSTKTIRIGSVWSTGDGAVWKAIDYYDLSPP